MNRPSSSAPRTRRIALAVAALCALGIAPATAAPKKSGGGDLFWLRPDAADLGIESIALLPVVTYDNNLEAERVTGQSVGMALKGSGHRWLSPLSSRALLSVDAAAADLEKRARAGVLEQARVDSLLAPELCRRLRTTAVLSVRVDQWEQRRLERNEPGKPSTSVIVRAALVDSAGRLVWSGSGSETLEGPEQQVDTRQPDLAGGSFGRGPAGFQSQAPAFKDVLDKLLARWTPRFPAKAAPAAAPAQP